LWDLSAAEIDIPEIGWVIGGTPTPMSAVLASKASLHHSALHSTRPLFVGTFKSLTYDWKEHPMIGTDCRGSAKAIATRHLKKPFFSVSYGIDQPHATFST
jgi:hypothetical protein